MEINKQLTLVDAIKANDERALRELYQENYKKVELHIIKNNGTMTQAKDLYQEAFLAMYQNIKMDLFVPLSETALQGYLYSIAKNKWIDFLRSAQYKKTRPLYENVVLADDANSTAELDEKIENEQKIELTLNAFSKLGKNCKNLLTQFYFDKKSMREIAVELGLEEASVRNKKYRCIQKLRELLNPTNI